MTDTRNMLIASAIFLAISITAYIVHNNKAFILGSDKDTTDIEQVEAINERIGGQDELLKKMYLLELKKLEVQVNHLKKEVAIRDYIIYQYKDSLKLERR